MNGLPKKFHCNLKTLLKTNVSTKLIQYLIMTIKWAPTYTYLSHLRW